MTSNVAPGGSVISSDCVLALDSLDSCVPRAAPYYMCMLYAFPSIVNMKNYDYASNMCVYSQREQKYPIMQSQVRIHKMYLNYMSNTRTNHKYVIEI